MTDGLTQEELLAVSGLMPVPPNVPQGPAKLPIPFTDALRLLVQCRRLDETKYWDNWAEALAAYAKMYSDDEVGREARLLRLHAYRRMGQLAEQLQPSKGNGRKGPQARLREEGVKHHLARQALAISQMTTADFAEITARELIPTPDALVNIELSKAPEWARIKSAIHSLRSRFKQTTPRAIAASLPARDKSTLRQQVHEAAEWLRQLEQELNNPS